MSEGDGVVCVGENVDSGLMGGFVGVRDGLYVGARVGGL